MTIFVLVILYTLVMIVLIDRFNRNKQLNLTRTEIALVYTFKVAMGVLYGYVFKKFYGGDDTWNYFNESLNEYNKLLFQTGRFFKEWIYLQSFAEADSFSVGARYFLQNTEHFTITKTLAVFNVISFQNYYIDVVFFNVFSFAGSYLLFKLFAGILKEKRLLVLIAAFFIPAVVFWLSGIRPDGLLLLCIALVLYYFNSWMNRKKLKDILLVMVGLAGVLLFRNQFLILLLPGLFSWWLSVQLSWNPWKCFGLVYLVCLLVFFGSSRLPNSPNLPMMVVKKQQEFMELKGNTVFKLDTLQPGFKSFISVLPQAFLNTFLRPFAWEAKGPLQWATALEQLFFWGVLITAIVNRKHILKHPLTAFIVFWGITTYLLIGLTVPYPGAIVRYKIIPEYLFLLLLLSSFPLKIKKN